MGGVRSHMVNYARLSAISSFLPDQVEDNTFLAEMFPEWSAEKIGSKTGIRQRHIARPDEFVSDLAVGAGRRLVAEHAVDLGTVDHLIVCTQSADLHMPVTAAIVHARLGLRQDCGANDINLGCSGFVYGLGLAKGLIETGQADNVLLITAETYSKFLNPADKSVRTIFGDGAGATLITGGGTADSLAAFVYGTDGSGGKDLIVPRGGLRSGNDLAGGAESDPVARGLEPSRWDLYMNGPAIFNFTLRVVPSCVAEVANKAGLDLDQIDLFVFHQANKFMLTHLAKKVGVPTDKLYMCMEDSGNTVSATIPIALGDAMARGAAKPGMRVMMVGFGVGLSWGGLVATL